MDQDRTAPHNELAPKPSAVKAWFGEVLSNEIIKICAVFLVAGALIKGCDAVNSIEIDNKKDVSGVVPDCKKTLSNEVMIDNKTYTLTCK